MILVTGGAGFIGANFVLAWLEAEAEPLVNVDKLTYAGNLGNLRSIRGDDRHAFVQADICDAVAMRDLLAAHRPRAIVHMAAESHVDRSIAGPEPFVQTNVLGTFQLLQAALEFWRTLPPSDQAAFRFLQVSTDEVYGALSASDPAFTEHSPYRPTSPYAASKAGADHLVRAYGHTYGLPILITHCSNNYGPYQFPEKLIPRLICNALAGQALPIYGDGRNIRDWLYVRDHCAAIRAVLRAGAPGETYNVGGNSERTNLQVAKAVCSLLDERRPRPDGQSYDILTTFVSDRPGHDFRYAIDASKSAQTLDWHPSHSFEHWLGATVDWYLGNQAWVVSVLSGDYLPRIGKG